MRRSVCERLSLTHGTNPTILHEAAVRGMLGVQSDWLDGVHPPMERVCEVMATNGVEGHIARRVPGEDQPPDTLREIHRVTIDGQDWTRLTLTLMLGYIEEVRFELARVWLTHCTCDTIRPAPQRLSTFQWGGRTSAIVEIIESNGKVTNVCATIDGGTNWMGWQQFMRFWGISESLSRSGSLPANKGVMNISAMPQRITHQTGRSFVVDVVMQLHIISEHVEPVRDFDL